MFDPKGDYTVDLSRVAESTSTSPTCRMLALYIMSKGGMASPGECLRQLPDEFVQKITLLSENKFDDKTRDQLSEDLLLTSLLINHAEGGTLNFEESIRVVDSLYALIIVESLARKGLVDLDYKNISLTDNLNKEIARISEKGTEYAKKHGIGGYSDDQF